MNDLLRYVKCVEVFLRRTMMSEPEERWIHYSEWDAMSREEQAELIEEELEKCEKGCTCMFECVCGGKKNED